MKYYVEYRAGFEKGAELLIVIFGWFGEIEFVDAENTHSMKLTVREFGRRGTYSW